MKRLLFLTLFILASFVASSQILQPNPTSSIADRWATKYGFRIPQVDALPAKPDLYNYTGDSASGAFIYCKCPSDTTKRGVYYWEKNKWIGPIFKAADISGTGTNGTLPLWTGPKTLGNSIITQPNNSTTFNNGEFISKSLRVENGAGNALLYFYRNSAQRTYMGHLTDGEFQIYNFTSQKLFSLRGNGDLFYGGWAGTGTRMVVVDDNGLTSTMPINTTNGTVTSVGISGGATGFSFLNSPITSSGTMTMSGTLEASNGGTGINSYTKGDLIYHNGAKLVTLPIGSSKQHLVVSNGLPMWKDTSDLSTVDAATLNGQPGSFYLNWPNFTNKPTTLTGYGISVSDPLFDTKYARLAVANTFSAANTFQSTFTLSSLSTGIMRTNASGVVSSSPLSAGEIPALPYIPTTHTVNNITNGTGLLKNNGSGTWSYDNNTYLTSASLTWNNITGKPTEFVPSAGSTYYIQNGTAQQASSSFNISGKGIVGDTLFAKAVKLQSGTGFLKADGTVDNSTYAPSSHNHDASYLKLTGGTLSGNLTISTLNSVGIVRTNSAGLLSTSPLVAGDIPSLPYIPTSHTVNNIVNGVGRLTNNGSGVWAYDNNAYITGNQTITLSGEVSGSGTTAITTTLKNTGTAGTYTKVTTDAQGRVISGSNIGVGDIPSLPYIPTSHTVNNITNGTGLLKNNGTGTWTYDNTTYLTSASLTWNNITGKPTEFAPTSGSSYYIQNGTTPQAGASFNIGGKGIVGDTLFAKAVKLNTGTGFMKADGTIDNNSYASSIHNHDGVYTKPTDVLFVGTTSIALNRASSAQTLTGVSIDGNAATVTNGVYTTGSYQNPTWITGLAWPKITATPTTLAGYGITDAASSTHNHDATYLKLTGGTLSGNLTISTLGTGVMRTNSSGLISSSPLVAGDIPALAYIPTSHTVNNIVNGTGLLRNNGTGTWTYDAGNYLTGNQTITLSGDVTGSGTTAITASLKNTGTAGTYTKVTTDAQGRVTSGTTLGAGDIPALAYIPTSHTVNAIANGTGFLKNNGTGTWTYDNSSYASASHNHDGVYTKFTDQFYIGTTAIALNRASGAQTLTGVSIDGNAGTVTNGVYTTGSYANPTWLTSLAWSKITSTPTTLAGYGITDAASSSHNHDATYLKLSGGTLTGLLNINAGITTPSGGAKTTWYNTSDQVSNYERVWAGWLSNGFYITNEKGGLASNRGLNINGFTGVSIQSETFINRLYITANGTGDPLIYIDRLGAHRTFIGHQNNTDFQIYNFASGQLFQMTGGSTLTYSGSLRVGSSADATGSAIAEFTSTTKGILPPQLDNNQMNAISSPALGLFGYNTTIGTPAFWDGTYWMRSFQASPGYVISNWNNVPKEGVWHGQDVALNSPSGNWFTAINLQIDNNGSFNNQIGVDIYGDWYVRQQQSGNWQIWKRLLTATPNGSINMNYLLFPPSAAVTFPNLSSTAHPIDFDITVAPKNVEVFIPEIKHRTQTAEYGYRTVSSTGHRRDGNPGWGSYYIAFGVGDDQISRFYDFDWDGNFTWRNRDNPGSPITKIFYNSGNSNNFTSDWSAQMMNARRGVFGIGGTYHDLNTDNGNVFHKFYTDSYIDIVGTLTNGYNRFFMESGPGTNSGRNLAIGVYDAAGTPKQDLMLTENDVLVTPKLTASNGFVYTKPVNFSGNMDNLTDAGFYDGASLTNAPNSGWFYIEVMRHSGDNLWVMQRATSFGTVGVGNVTWQRTKVGGTWGVWELINDVVVTYTGQSSPYVIPGGATLVVIDPPSAYNLTITLPTNAYPNQLVTIVFGGTIPSNSNVCTNFGMNGGPIQSPSPPLTIVSGTSLGYRYINNKWYRVQ